MATRGEQIRYSSITLQAFDCKSKVQDAIQAVGRQ